MTEDEANLIARIIATADNGCSSCVKKLTEALNRAFPGLRWIHNGREGRQCRVRAEEVTMVTRLDELEGDYTGVHRR